MVRKIKNIKFIILAAVIAGAFSLGGCVGDPAKSLHEYWNAHYEYTTNENGAYVIDCVRIYGLTEEGEKQKYLTLPKEIGGQTKIRLEASINWGGSNSEKVGYLGNVLEGVTFEGKPEIVGRFFAGTSSLRWIEVKEKIDKLYYPEYFYSGGGGE